MKFNVFVLCIAAVTVFAVMAATTPVEARAAARATAVMATTTTAAVMEASNQV